MGIIEVKELVRSGKLGILYNHSISERDMLKVYNYLFDCDLKQIIAPRDSTLIYVVGGENKVGIFVQKTDPSVMVEGHMSATRVLELLEEHLSTPKDGGTSYRDLDVPLMGYKNISTIREDVRAGIVGILHDNRTYPDKLMHYLFGNDIVKETLELQGRGYLFGYREGTLQCTRDNVINPYKTIIITSRLLEVFGNLFIDREEHIHKALYNDIDKSNYYKDLWDAAQPKLKNATPFPSMPESIGMHNIESFVVSPKITLTGKYLVQSDEWFLAPDGKYYRAVWGEIKVVQSEEMLGIKTNARSTNWYVMVGNPLIHVIIAGCKIHHCVKCNKEVLNPSLDVRDYVVHDGLINFYSRPNAIYIIDDLAKEECDHDYSDGTGTGYNVCKKCGDLQ